jgi:hypothetical protein
MTCCWILVGNYNMVEFRCDKTNQCGKLLPQHERLLLAALKAHLQLHEPPRTMGSLPFLWDNLRWDGARILAKLDRLYTSIPAHASGNPTVTMYTIRGDGTHSDHQPLQTSLQPVVEILTESAKNCLFYID